MEGLEIISKPTDENPSFKFKCPDNNIIDICMGVYAHRTFIEDIPLFIYSAQTYGMIEKRYQNNPCSATGLNELLKVKHKLDNSSGHVFSIDSRIGNITDQYDLTYTDIVDILRIEQDGPIMVQSAEMYIQCVKDTIYDIYGDTDTVSISKFFRVFDMYCDVVVNEYRRRLVDPNQLKNLIVSSILYMDKIYDEFKVSFPILRRTYN
jgi:hypothetical protein